MSEEHPVVGPSDPLIGSVLAERYRIERRLGEGGMGAVYLARHVILEKIVALKILHAEYARRRELVERFLHEAKAASRIRHEHVIDITDFGETADKNVFFAMEYLEGMDLATLLDRERHLDWPRIKGIILQLCAALQAAHEAGVIHRDLKPENIFLIERLGHSDFVKVLDFGVAKLTEIEEGRERRLTRTGMVFGTPEYMSPEQARGEKPDPRVDVYAVGCILFELVTGDVPFRGDNFMGVLSKHLFDPAPPLSERTTRDDLPEGLQEIISQAMAKDKNDRFGSMNELAVALDTLDYTEGIAYHAPGTMTPDKARRAQSAHPLSPRGAAPRLTPIESRGGEPRAAPRSAARPAVSVVPPSKPLPLEPDDDTETTLRKVRPPRAIPKSEPPDEQPARRSMRGLAVFFFGAAAAIALGVGALAIVRATRGSSPPVVQPSDPPPRAVIPPPTVTSPPAVTPPEPAAPAHEPAALTAGPADAAPPPPEPAAAATPDAGVEPTVVTVPPEPEPEPEPTPSRKPPASRRRDRDRDRRHTPPPPVISPEAKPVSTPPPPSEPPEPAVPKTDLKDPFRKK